MKKIWEKYLDRLVYFENTGSNIEVSKDNYSYLYDLLRSMLNSRYQGNSTSLSPKQSRNWCICNWSKQTCNSHNAAIERLDEQELLYVIAHELGHIKSGHVLYYYLASNLAPFLQIAGQLSLGIGALAGNGVKIALYYWRRIRIYCNRAGLLVCKILQFV